MLNWETLQSILVIMWKYRETNRQTDRQTDSVYRNTGAPLRWCDGYMINMINVVALINDGLENEGPKTVLTSRTYLFYVHDQISQCAFRKYCNINFLHPSPVNENYGSLS